MRHGIRLVVVGATLPLLGAGCASVEWTEELFAKRKVEVDERFVKVETDVRQQGDRIDRVEVRVAQIDTKLTETRDLVRPATPPVATTTVARATPPAESRPPRPAPEPSARATRTLIAVIHVPFGFDRADLGPAAEAALTAILKELRDNPGLTLDLEGSTDPVGRLEYNVRLSQRRVEAVRRWLVAHGVERGRIVGSAARGPAVNGAVKDDLKRRVMVKLMGTSE
jgi:outer membrane protein OmpA-like peptidoglycan-associated protein